MRVLQNCAKQLIVKFANLDGENAARQLQQIRHQVDSQPTPEPRILMVQERQHDEGSQYVIVHDRPQTEDQQPPIVMVQERQVELDPTQQQLLMIQGHPDQPHQQFVIIQNRRDQLDQQMLHYEYSPCDEKEPPLQQPPRAHAECEPSTPPLHMMTIGTETAAHINPPVYFNPTALRTFPIEVSTSCGLII